MQIKIDVNTDQVKAAMDKAAGQLPFALKTAINRTAEKAKKAIQAEMPRVFDKPTPWVVNSLRLKYATKTNLTADIAFKDRNSAESSRTMIEPHVYGGNRHFGAMEARLRGIGLIPDGWNAVPGEAARLDQYGNMSRGQISQVLNVLGTYTEAGYNKANAKTVARLAKGNAKKGVYGFVYWVNPVNGPSKGKHIPPGVYQRVSTGFGTSLKPVLIFVKRANYKRRLDFYGIAQTTIDKEFPSEFTTAFDEAMRTALLKNQGSLL
jgi:hypothetical protein